MMRLHMLKVLTLLTARTDLQTLDETELILELVKDISNDLDVRSLCHKILQVTRRSGIIVMTLKNFDDLY